MLLIYFFFFFSSRRRHTRLQGDWSSDVCSSDLSGIPLVQRDAVPGRSARNGRRLLFKGGIVLSMDRNIGDFEKADVLIEGKKIAAVGPSLKAEAEVIDATDRIVMPGFVDT